MVLGSIDYWGLTLLDIVRRPFLILVCAWCEDICTYWASRVIESFEKWYYERS